MLLQMVIPLRCWLFCVLDEDGLLQYILCWQGITVHQQTLTAGIGGATLWSNCITVLSTQQSRGTSKLGQSSKQTSRTSSKQTSRQVGQSSKQTSRAASNNVTVSASVQRYSTTKAKNQREVSRDNRYCFSDVKTEAPEGITNQNNMCLKVWRLIYVTFFFL